MVDHLLVGAPGASVYELDDQAAAPERSARRLGWHAHERAEAG